MQITTNTTGMAAELTVATDKFGRDYCVVVVKGTFAVDKDGEAHLAEEQEPFVFADAHHGDPGETSIEYECDFAPFKSHCDVLVNGSAYAPQGKAATKVPVGLKIGSLIKTFNVVGDRVWRASTLRADPGPPEPFVTMPITYDRAFGGCDNFHPDQSKHSAYMANPVGRGYHEQLAAKFVDGTPLPNTEEQKRPVTAPDKTYQPMSFGPLGRGWAPRIKFAGTYDEAWLATRCPLLPEDFDDRYFQSAPQDQQIPFMQGGEIIRCINMSPEPNFVARIPAMDIPITFKFWNRKSKVRTNLDTVVVEPDRSRILLMWRASIPLGRKIHALREVAVGPDPWSIPRSSKPRFKGIQKFIEWKTKGIP